MLALVLRVIDSMHTTSQQAEVAVVTPNEWRKEGDEHWC